MVEQVVRYVECAVLRVDEAVAPAFRVRERGQKP
jgi:hypothetical protein